MYVITGVLIFLETTQYMRDLVVRNIVDPENIVLILIYLFSKPLPTAAEKKPPLVVCMEPGD